MREQYDAYLCDGVKCGKCDAKLVSVKPQRTSRIDLNDEKLYSETNIFYICFSCQWVAQVGHGEIYKPEKKP